MAALRRLGPGEIDDRDGLKWVGAGGWVHVRPSNTEPLLRLNLEAPTRAECDAHVVEVLGLVASH